MNTLYKVWGIITYVFTGFYTLGWAIATGVFLILKQKAGAANESGFSGEELYDGDVPYIPAPYMPDSDGERSQSGGCIEALDTSYNGTFYENAVLPNGIAATVEAGGKLVIGDADSVLSLYIE